MELPNRRRTVRDYVRWPPEVPPGEIQKRPPGRRIHVEAGFNDSGALCETFLRGGGQVGSDIDYELDDLAILISWCLQHGASVQTLAATVLRITNHQPASKIGLILDKLVQIDTAERSARPGDT